MMLISNHRPPPSRLGLRRKDDSRTSSPAADRRAATPGRVPPRGPPDGHLLDWSEALNAVPTRLRQIVGLRLATDSGLPVSDVRAKIQIDVLECAAAMDLLNATLLRELRRCHQLEHPAMPVQAGTGPPDASAGERDARHPAPRERQSPMSLRRRFRQQLDRALVDTEPPGTTPALLTLDLDGFRPITEIHGPDVSDHVLQIIAARLRCVVRAADVVCRIGVQEFGCLLTGSIGRTRLCQVARKMFDAASAPLRVGNLWLHVTPSIGIAHGSAFATGAAGAAGMLLGANGAMRQAKQQRSGYAFFDPPSRRPNRRADATPRPAVPRPPDGTP